MFPRRFTILTIYDDWLGQSAEPDDDDGDEDEEWYEDDAFMV